MEGGVVCRFEPYLGYFTYTQGYLVYTNGGLIGTRYLWEVGYEGVTLGQTVKLGYGGTSFYTRALSLDIGGLGIVNIGFEGGREGVVYGAVDAII